MRYERSVKTVNERASGHESRVRDLSIQRDQLETKANRISFFRLVTFLGAAAALVTGLKQALPLAFLGAVVLALAFVTLVAWHARVIERRNGVEVRIAVNQRQLKRIGGHWQDLPSRGDGLLDPSHPYASDIDLTGEGSLFQRIDVSQTREGERALATALSEPAPWPLIEARHPAVRELASKEVFREEIEALACARQQHAEKLDHSPFMALFALRSLFDTRRWLKPLMLGLVLITVSVAVLIELDLAPAAAIWACVFAQGLLLWALREPVHGALDLLTARIGFAQAYQTMFRAIEQESFSAPYLQGLQRRLRVRDSSASVLMARLSRYEGFAQLRTQGPLYIVLNLLTLWDLFCLERIEHFAKDVGPHCADWFKAVGEVELLCSFATLLHVDPSALLPKLDDAQVGLHAQGLLHPLLPAATRVANDVELPGSGAALLVTGSNMAGKSTLLRAVGLNIALALAGAPVCAQAFSVSLVRLRASMRIDDSLQRGASYFHAELTRLRMVVSELETGAPVFFLLDELLRGTNAHARHQGARAVLLHLLSRGSLGLVATHDVALSELEDELPGQVHNVHFTDVFEGGEMRFDYTLRAGVVKTSNALRLLAMAGIEVPDSDAVA